MKKNLISFLALIMSLVMLLGILASCTGGGQTDDTESEGSESSESEKGTEPGEEDPDGPDIPGGNGDGDGDGDDGDDVGPALSGNHADIIGLADSLKNNVSMYFPSGDRNNVIYENMNMVLDYALDVTMQQQVTSLKNKSGNTYLENTMDVFVEMGNGNRYYAKDSYTDATPNIYRFGYYFYEMRAEGQTFIKDASVTGAYEIDHTRPIAKNDVKNAKAKDGILRVVNEDAAADPYIVISNNLKVDTSIYTMLEITMKADADTTDKADIFYVAGSQTGFNGGQRINIAISNDGQYHTYAIPLYMGPEYTGTLSALRFDIDGAGAQYEISSIRFLGVDVDGAPTSLSLCRVFNVYSDKMHQVIQIAATTETEDVTGVGIVTRLAADTVAKLIVKDKDEELHTSLESVDWDSVEYVAFDVIDAGIFGYILPFDGKGGSLKVTLDDGYYVIEQIRVPENNTIKPSRTDYNEEMSYYNWVEGGNTNDFYMGNRIYTDASHDFEKFLYEAYCERNPLSEANFKVYEGSSTNASYVGYDSLRGIYRFNLAGAQGGFSTPYYQEPNKQYRVNFTVRGDKYDRDVYILTHTTVGQLESAALLDENDVMIAVPLEVGKNFSEQGGDRNLYNLADLTYGEVIFPVSISAGEKYEYTVLNLYQNWGNYPLKQISWIQFFSPYYHLSTGVTETNCILPWMFTDRIWYNTLPDHRGMSAPHWASQPQHTSSGEHDWLRYVDSEGNVVRWENVWNTIDSYGPTYADVKMDYITYDGKMKVSYTHTEMPQTDENRSFYEMTYEVLEDITINNFVTDFQFYKVDPNDKKGIYQKVGYLNEQNESVVVDANLTSAHVKYVLGDQCPYFSFFDMDNHSDPNGYGNLAFLVYNSEFVIGGEKVEPNFAIVNYEDTIYVTLNIEEATTLKAGDKFTINAILLPWGSHLLDDGIIDEAAGNYEYTMRLPDGSLYMDKNVRDVRENTLLDPLKAIAGANSEVVESVFVPKVKSTNGVDAEFTLTGGYNNVAVRVYGFNKHTVPVIYELLGGEWVIYDVSSQNAEKDPHRYDGYAIHYDGDGTYSYSFVTDMDGENDRTFKIVADGNYTKWTKETGITVNRTDHLDLYFDPFEIAENGGAEMLSHGFASSYEVITGERLDELDSYLRIYGGGLDAQYGEGYAYVYRADGSDKKAGGRYLVVKYRIPEENTETTAAFEFYLSTSDSGPKNGDCSFNTNAIVADGEWNVLIFDVTKITKTAFQSHFVASSDGKYYPNFIRFDFFDRKMSESSYIDIGYVGMDDSLEDIVLTLEGCKTVTLYEGDKESVIDPESGKVTTNYFELPNVLVDPSSGYTTSTLEFGGHLDNVNGKGVGLQAGSGIGVASKLLEVGTIADNSVTDFATVSGHKLMVSGWCIVQGGINRYVWSADGGKTWNDFTNLEGNIRDAGSEIVAAANGRTNKTVEFTMADSANGSFQGASGNNPKGLVIDLEAYKGETVNIIIGAVPATDTSSIIPLFYLGKIIVAE